MTSSPRSWIVTGGTKGIGRAIAERALSEGERVAVVSREPDGSSLSSEYPATCLVVAGDVTVPSSIERAVAQVHNQWGGVDVLVNNAGIHRGGKIDRLSTSDWQSVLETNLSGAFNTIRSALPFLNQGGAIVNIGAVVGLRGFKGDVAYASAKAGLVGLTHALAIELADRSITVNVVLPGLTETEMVKALSDSAKESLKSRVPLGRMASKGEIADVVWSVSRSTYMTGSIVPVDGGLMSALGSAR